MRGLYTLAGLHCQRRYRRDSVAIMRGKSFPIGRDARATRRIESSNGENNRESRTVMVVIVQLAAASAPDKIAGCANRLERADNSDCTRGARRTQDFSRSSTVCVS